MSGIKGVKFSCETMASFSIKLVASAACGWADTLYETTPKWHGLLMIRLAETVNPPEADCKH